MDKNERGKETFIARVATGYRLTIYKPVRDVLGIEVGDTLRVTVQITRAEKEAEG